MWQVAVGVRISKLTALAGLWAFASSWGRLGVREHTSRAALRGARSKILRQAWRERSYMRSWGELFLVVRGVRRGSGRVSLALCTFWDPNLGSDRRCVSA